MNHEGFPKANNEDEIKGPENILGVEWTLESDINNLPTEIKDIVTRELASDKAKASTFKLEGYRSFEEKDRSVSYEVRGTYMPNRAVNYGHKFIERKEARYGDEDDTRPVFIYVKINSDEAVEDSKITWH